MALEDSVSLDISDALASIDRLGAGLTQSAQTFGVELASALDNLREPVPVTADASAVTPEIEQALAAADTQVEPTADASAIGVEVTAAVAGADATVVPDAETAGLESSITLAVTDADAVVTPDADTTAVVEQVESAVAAADGVVPVEADTEGVPAAIEEAVASADTVLTIDADAENVTAQLDAAVHSADTTIVVDGDVSGLEEQLAGLDTDVSVTADTEQAEESLTDLGVAASGASGGLGGAETAMGSLGVAATLASGNVGGLKTGFTQLVPGSSAVGGAVAGVGAVVAATSVFVDAALGARESADTFAIAVGDMGDEVNSIDVGGLNTDLGELAVSLGQDDEAASDAAARIFQFGEATGEARPKVAKTTEEIIALAAQAIALNPALGDLGTVAEGMVGALARGGPKAAQLGIDLNSAEITARAFKDRLVESNEPLSVFERTAAGAAIAVEDMGASIGTDIQARVDTTTTGFARFSQELANVTEAAGAPLIDPLLESLERAQPGLEATAAGLGGMLAEVIPLAAEIGSSLAPVMVASAEAAGQMATGLGLVVQALDDTVAILPGGIEGFGEFAGGVSRALNPLTPFIDGIEGLKGPWEDLFGGGAAPGVVEHGNEVLEKSLGAFAAAGEAAGTWTRAQTLSAIEANTAADGTINWDAALKDLEATEQVAITTTEIFAGTEEDLATAAQAAKDAINAQREATDSLLGVFVSVEEAELRYIRAQDDLNEATNKVWKAQAAHTEAVRIHGEASGEATMTGELLRLTTLDLRDAQVGAFNSAKDLTTSVFEQAEALKTAGPEADALRGQLVAMRDRFPELRDQIDKYIGKVDQIDTPDLHMGEAVDRARVALSGMADVLGPITEEQARRVGKVFGQGLANGINSESERLRVAGALAGERVTQAARQSFGMRSPSRVGIEIGENFTEAIAAGIAASQAVAVAEAERLASRISDSAAVFATAPLTAAQPMWGPSAAVAAPSSGVGQPLVTIAHADFSDPVDVDVFGQRLAFQMSVPR